MTSVLDIARALIRCPSVTPHEAGALSFLQSLFENAGFTTHRVTFSEAGTPDVDNLYARIGTGAPHLTFAGHTDVVPPGDETLWRFPPFAAEVADGKLYGRGACDMKGGIAAFAAATLSHVRENGAPRGSISFLITGDEEGPSINGTVKLLQWAAARGEKFDHAIVGEPTCPETLGDMIKIGRRGSLSGEIVVTGRQGHSAYPQRADNPIPTLARIVTALSEKPLDEGTDAFEPTRLVFTSVDVGNGARNVIPGAARALFNVRFNDAWTPQTLGARIRDIAARAAGEAKAEVSLLPTNSLAFRTQRSAFTDIVIGAIKEKTGLSPELSTGGGTSDARFITHYCPVVEFGLVGKTIHATDENTTLADLETLTAIYGAIIERYFA
ncbi:MAG: succinyl-diaminopimelate desuccinylase [Hyphomicrobiales bacterium]|nr:succinyl-diaminopimelate desuccinylase [Hyphomicrobiales bacterium]